MDSKKQLKIVVKVADSKRAEDIIVLDARNVSLLVDYLMICSANNERQISTITEKIIDKEEENRYEIKHVGGKKGGEWVLIGFGDSIVHAFHTPGRSFYSLEKPWLDALLIDLNEWLD